MQVQLTFLSDSPDELRDGVLKFAREYGGPKVEIIDTEELTVENLLAKLQAALPNHRITVTAAEDQAPEQDEPDLEEEEAPPAAKPAKPEKAKPEKAKPEKAKPEKAKPAKPAKVPPLHVALDDAKAEPEPAGPEHVPDTSSDPAKDMEEALELLGQVYGLPEGKTAIGALRAKYQVAKFSLLPKERGPELLQDAKILAQGFGLPT